MDAALSSTFWLGLLQIIWVNILLSGDNAVVIALAARALRPSQQKHAIIWGAAAAVVLRIILTIFAVRMLQLPWLKLIGAVLLVWIGIRLIGDEDDEADIRQSASLLGAIKTILIADLVMSLDNVLAVAAAAQSAPASVRMVLLVFGLALSIPIVIFGSTLVLRLMQRWPVVVTVGAMLLGWIAGEMAAAEPVMAAVPGAESVLQDGLGVLGALLVLFVGKWLARNMAKAEQPEESRE